MATQPTLKEQLAELESAVREMQRRMESQSPVRNWLENVIGSFKDEPAFEEVLEYGRALRQADRPSEDAEP
jgi:hypothetical protein